MVASESDILAKAEEWAKEERGVALATVIETWGSAPRPVGSHLVIDENGSFLGSVSETGKSRMLAFGVADETAWRAGLSCGGRIKVYVEKLD
jgi:xanthine/CO dehydrogenase XdhC/CoxF family maturation factor